MRQRGGTILANIDWILILLYFLLVLMGWVSIYSAVYNEEFSSIFDTSQKYGKQLLWIGTSVVLILVIMILDTSLFETLAYPIYILSLLSLVAVLIFGTEISGARSWFTFGGFSIQPAEFAKIATALALAKLLSTKGVSLTSWKAKMIAAVILFLPAAIILPQPDAGSAIVYSAFFLALYREGLSANFIFIGLGLVVVFILSLIINPYYLMGIITGIGLLLIFLTRRMRGYWLRILGVVILGVGFIQTVDYSFNNILEDRHRNRINILLGKAHDPQGIGYNTNQSMIAIGSGGFSGKGFLEGTQTKYDFVPEQSTDFIFCTVGEEWGFIGSTIVIALFLLLFFRLVIVAERQKSIFSRVYGYCVVSILFFHFAVNIAMTIGLAPVVGIPLPFFSYGGSSLWGFTLLLFIFIKLDSSRKQIW